MDEETAKQLLGDIQFSPGASNLVSQLPSIPQPPAPSPIDRPTVKKEEEAFKHQYAEPGVPLDTETGASPWERLMLEVRRSRDNQIAYLENKYPGKVRMTPAGELIFRVPDSENKGEEKDILAVPHGKLTISDLINIAAAMPEVGGWLAAEKGLTRVLPQLAGPGIAKTAARLGGGAIGAETVGALTKDIPLSAYDQGQVNFPEIGKSRAGQAAADVGVGAALHGVGKIWDWARSPLWASRGELAPIGEEGQQWAQSRYGNRIPMTVGERTGIPFFMRSEAFVEKEPGGFGPIQKVASERDAALRNLQNLMMGGRPPLDEEVGQRAINEIQSKIAPVVQAEATSREALASSAQNSLEGIVSGLTYPDRQVYKDSLGEEIRNGVIAKRDAQKAEADRLYSIVRSLPGGTGKVFDGRPLQQKFESILKNLPSMEETVTQPTGILGPTGKPISNTIQRETLLQKWPPDKLLARLNEITSAKDPKFALSDLVQMRRDVYDDIAKGEGVPDLGTRYLSQIGTALTEAIDQGVSSLPNGALKSAIQAADKHYKENVIPFNRPGLTELFRSQAEPGYVAPDRVLNRVIEGGDINRNWKLMQETLGTSSPTYMKLRRALADNLIEPARNVGEDTLDAKTVVKNLYDFQRKHKEIYDEVFGPKEKELFRSARMLTYAQGDKIEASELQRLLRSPDPSAPKLKALIDAEKAKTDLYRNDLIKSIGDGTVDETTLKPTEFASRLLSDKGFGVEDTKKLMDLIKSNPTLTTEIRQKTLEKVFREAARASTADDLPKIIAGDPTHILSGVSLGKAIKDPTVTEKLKVLLGKDGFDDLTGYIKLTAPLEKKEEAYALAGGLASGSRVGQLEKAMEGKGGLLRFAGNTARSFVFSWMLSNPASRWYLGEAAGANPFSRWYVKNMPMELEDARKYAVHLMASPPFIEAVAKQFPGVTGARFINDLKASIERSVNEQPKPREQRDMEDMKARPTTEEEKRLYWKKQLESK